MLGGTVSVIAGGKFANGAVTAAFAQAFGEAASRSALHDSSGLSERTDAAEINRVATLATTEANEALGDLIGHPYGTLNEAAAAWRDSIISVANKYDTEIASRFFMVKGKFAFGAAVSDGLRNTVDPSVSRLPGAFMTAGYIHTHPSASLFSPNDLNFAVEMYKRANSGWFAGGADQSAFVASRGGGLYRWNVSEYISSGGASWMNSAYYHKVGQ